MSDASAQEIVNYLATQQEPVKTIDIAHAIFGAEATAKHVNSTLYRLAGQKILEKTSEASGANPRWSISPVAGQRAEYRQGVLQLLQANREALSTGDLAKRVVSETAKSKDINPVLYALEKEGVITKVSEDGKKPKWMLRA